MNITELIRRYGDEYPAAVVSDGIRLPLRKERRFSRSYHSEEHKLGCEISRFMDGSASITSAQLQQEWPSWNKETRMDFCAAYHWLNKQPDFPEMLRFIMQHGGPDEWSAIALDVASRLPQNEAFEILLRALRTMELGRASNITQAIAATKHPGAEATLRRHLDVLWRHPDLWHDADFSNWIAFEATTCIRNLIDLGAPPEDFNEQVRLLSEHSCSGNRNSCRNFLAKHYAWLK